MTSPVALSTVPSETPSPMPSMIAFVTLVMMSVLVSIGFSYGMILYSNAANAAEMPSPAMSCARVRFGRAPMMFTTSE